MEQRPNKSGKKDGLSEKMLAILNEEIMEAEVESAIDAAAEEGFIITREQALRILSGKSHGEKDNKNVIN